MSELRQRPIATSKSSNGPDKESNPRQHTINDETDQDHGISLLDIIRQGPVTLTPSQLSLYNGTDTNLPLYVAVNGTIFDVSANRMIYGPGGSYNFFAGRDATRAFVTGCFKEDLTNDLRGVEIMFLPVEDVEDEGVTSAQRKIRREKELRAARARVEETVKRWTGFFANHAKYFEAGRVVEDGGVHGEPWPLCESAQKQRPKRSAMMEKS
ncbi:Pc21g22980 [Penicillium rubens Wisconsin 54-1255]|uniref:Pc21g22980 protein n=1 Tax=Penicillium rubens (strain ATCC 28089 / DSM 1075 / NRRL 1951 / Wisconsin 54-1255) TaxID=500485 RepID=B6HHV0_PENRW|nr:Pc21g22980 [Penicillium rubens Wisconsin 54-1255]